MSNLIAFLNEFLSYLLVFVVFVITMLAAGKIGTSIRKKKNMEALAEVEAGEK